MRFLEYTELMKSGLARRGKLKTKRGIIETPAFMPVGTLGTVKSLLPNEIIQLGAGIVLANTYHLLLRPGVDVITALGGLHRFMGWERPILTDSGGFQIFSLASLRRVEETGVIFCSHLDGSLLTMTPESVIVSQEKLDSDIMMMLDECPPVGSSKDYIRASLLRDARWAVRAQAVRKNGALMGIVQGGFFPDLRQLSVELLGELEMDGYALGGVSVGESKEVMMDIVAKTVPLLPHDKPIYLMGVGDPVDLVTCVGFGVDLFDCVLPTRMARNGTLFTSYGRLNIRNKRYRDDNTPIDENCACFTCLRYSRAYLRHLFIARELLSYRLNAIHNLYYILNLMAELREAITYNRYPDFMRNFIATFFKHNMW